MLRSSAAPMATDHNTITVNEPNFLVRGYVAKGNNKGSDRLFSLPTSMHMPEILDLLACSFRYNDDDWDMKTAELLFPITVCGRRYWSSTDMDSLGYSDERITLGDLDAAVGSSGLAIRVEFWAFNGEDGNVPEHKATYEMNLIGRSNANDGDKGKIACLSVTNLVEDDPKKVNLAEEVQHLADYLGKERVLACQRN